MLETLEEYSVLALYSAMVVYSLAFVFYAVDLANRSGDSSAALANGGARKPAASTATGAAGGGTTTLVRPAVGSAGSGTVRTAPRSRALRIGFSLTVLGFLFHLAATILRGIAAERVPFANMYEFALTATLSIVGIFLLVQFFVDLRFLGALVTGLAVLFLGLTKINFYVSIVPLMPALDSYWLVIHILVAVLAVGFLTLSFGLSVLQLLQTRRENFAGSGPGTMSFLGGLPDSNRLEDFAYRMAIIGFVFWSFTLIAGSIWAEAAWSRYWGWDTKEVWTLVIWVLYAGFIHARATRGWRGTRSAWLSIVAYAAVIFNFAIVNVFFKGLHAYSGL
ncbi:c-type cytochrome biogenesis protein CcsB [Leucobacter weissii]|uniref:C-type cytochrome biogenesis protein CcsB n=1 Tax=Leucobacter weissii TaxID=1983706 RepID=A0A939MKY5_9MICO|nr:c-type cytochrome biogenesis protein CcsB [Leucobacter weissii]MBO1900547.1 c-type cytochrome biogenesis protein CcsB [Leucobacter weissii]